MAKKAPKNINTPLPEEEAGFSDFVFGDEPEEAPQAVLDTLKSTALQVVSITDLALASIEEKYAEFSINGDTKAYKEAKYVKNKLVKIRGAIDRKRIATNKTFTESNNELCKAVIDRTTAVESHLAIECTNFEEAELRRIEARRNLVVNSLIDSGFQFNGIAYVCGDQTVWQTEVDSITDEQLNQYVVFAFDWHAKERARMAAEKLANQDVYLHHQESNELLTIKRGEFDAQAYADSGVIEITHELYQEIQRQKLDAFKRPPQAPIAADPQFQSNTNPAPPKQSVLERFNANAGAASFIPAPSAPTMEGLLDEYEQGFNSGFEACRSIIIGAFQNPTLSYKRAEWIEYFKSIKSVPTL